jgi:TusA-related sulfurtransferase
MSKRRTHSSLDTLAPYVLSAINLMITDGIWPGDAAGKQLRLTSESGKPTYDDITAWLKASGFDISRSAVGRYARRIAWMSRMRNSADLAKNVMAEIDETNVSKTQKAVAEMITARAIELLADDDKATANDLRRYSQAIKDCTAIAIKSDQYVRERIETKARAAAKNIESSLKTEISAEKLKFIKEQVYGVFDLESEESDASK